MRWLVGLVRWYVQLQRDLRRMKMMPPSPSVPSYRVRTPRPSRRRPRVRYGPLGPVTPESRESDA